MNRVTLALVVILAAFLLGGVGGWHVRKAYEPQYDFAATARTLDSLRTLNERLISEAETFKAAADSAMAAAERVPVKYIQLRGSIPTASDSALVNIILWKR